jgi:hypothetical protein
MANVHAALIFSQDFSASTDMAQYVSASPDSGQWNDITGGSISLGALRFDRPLTSSAAGSFTRNSDLAPAPDALIYKFDLSVGTTTSSASGAALWQVGTGFSTTVNGAEAGNKVFAQFALDFTDTHGGFTFRDPQGNRTYSGGSFSGSGLRLTWVVNQSGSPLQYSAPNGTVQSVGNNRWDLWASYQSIFDEALVTTTADPMTDLKFAFTGGKGTITLDNFSIDSLSAVPEPAATSLVGAVLAGLFPISRACVRFTRSRRLRGRQRN